MSGSCVSGKDQIASWSELESLATQHGDGFWLLDLERFRRNLDEFLGAFVQAGWARTINGWSLKTSWLPPVVHAAMNAGALCEVVSRHEYDLALALGASLCLDYLQWPAEDATGFGFCLQQRCPRQPGRS